MDTYEPMNKWAVRPCRTHDDENKPSTILRTKTLQIGVAFSIENSLKLLVANVGLT